MSKFKVGDKVIALVTTLKPGFSQNLIKGKIYVIQKIKYCSECGEQSINIGENEERKSIRCKNCGSSFESKGYAYSSSKRFVLLDEIDELVEECINNEDYEMLIELKKHK